MDRHCYLLTIRAYDGEIERCCMAGYTMGDVDERFAREYEGELIGISYVAPMAEAGDNGVIDVDMDEDDEDEEWSG